MPRQHSTKSARAATLPGLDFDDESGDERWLPVCDYPGYEVSDQGGVRSYWKRRGEAKGQWGIGSTARLLKCGTKPDGRRFLFLSRPGCKPRYKYVAVLVLESFVGLCPPGMEACHAPDWSPANNRLENLRWDTPTENQRDKLRHDRHTTAKLIEADIPVIWDRLLSGDTGRAIARDFGVSPAAISVIRSGKCWSHITRSLPGWPIVPQIHGHRDPVYPSPELADPSVERWTIVPDWPAYRASNLGRIQSRWTRRAATGTTFGRKFLGDEWRDIATPPICRGYPAFTARHESGKQKLVKVSRIVLETFVGPSPIGMDACHGPDPTVTNCRLENLRWDTKAANAQDRFRHARERLTAPTA